jgi:hypothetical protein
MYVQEMILDYVFDKLSITGDHVAHPVLLTESLCTPSFSRESALCT